MLEKERKAVVAKLATLSPLHVMNYITKEKSKDGMASELARIEGNTVFKEIHDLDTHEYVWEKYTESIAIAPNDSEKLALAYANRSALLFHLAKYQDCIVDIERAISITNSNVLKAKWLCRKVKCLHALDLPDAQKLMEEAKSFMDHIKDRNKDTKQVEELLKSTEKLLGTRNTSKKLKERNYPRIEKTLDDFSDVAIKSDPKKGMKLVATRDIQPGEVIFAQKPFYASILNVINTCPCCSHCFAPCLTTIPCNSCNWMMFCSDQCKRDAWEQYHDLECPVLKNYIGVNCSGSEYSTQIALHIAITECRKRGGISNLKSHLENIVRNKGVRAENLIKDGKLIVDEFETIFIAPSHLLSDMYIESSLCTVFNLAVHTDFFGKKFSINECKQLMSNEDFIFMCALLYKLEWFATKAGTCKKVRALTKHSCMYRSCSISTVLNFVNHNCDPNVSRDVTADNNTVLYAVQPIKKNDEICICYTMSYKTLDKSARHQQLKNIFSMSCDCKACKEDWPPLYRMSMTLFGISPEQIFDIMVNKTLEKELFLKHKKVIINEMCRGREFRYTKETLSDLAKSVVVAVRDLPHPAVITSILITTLNFVFVKLYMNVNPFIPEKCIK